MSKTIQKSSRHQCHIHHHMHIEENYRNRLYNECMSAKNTRLSIQSRTRSRHPLQIRETFQSPSSQRQCQRNSTKKIGRIKTGSVLESYPHQTCWWRLPNIDANHTFIMVIAKKIEWRMGRRRIMMQIRKFIGWQIPVRLIWKWCTVIIKRMILAWARLRRRRRWERRFCAEWENYCDVRCVRISFVVGRRWRSQGRPAIRKGRRLSGRRSIM